MTRVQQGDIATSGVRPSEIAHSHWSIARAWQTNTVLILIGIVLFGLTRQLIVESDHFVIGFSGCSGWSLTMYLIAAWLILTQPVDRWTFPIILTVGIVCRLVTLFPDPFLSSDVYRYAWDGVVQHAHINPYRYVPGDKALTFLRRPNDDLFNNMNRRDYAHTIYPPVAQAAFFLITWVSPLVIAMKFAMVLWEGVTMWGLAALLRARGVRREQTLLYAWCPLLIWEIAGSGHLDSMVMALVVLALLARARKQDWLVGLFLGLAVLTKFYPLVLAPALWRRGDRKMPATVAALSVAFYSLYLSVGKMVFGFLMGYADEEGLKTGTRFFLLEFAHKLPGLGNLSERTFQVLAAAVFLALIVWAWRTGASDRGTWDFLAPTTALAMALMLLFSPHYPWYVAWIVPFFVIRPSLTLIAYVGAMFYLCTTDMAVGYGPRQFMLNEFLYATVLIAALVEAAFRYIPGGSRALGWVLPAPPPARPLHESAI